MKRSRFSDEQIIGILKEHQAGLSAKELCRKYGVSDATFYRWRSKYGGMDVSEAKRLKSLEEENGKLKRLLADAMLDVSTLREMLGKKTSDAWVEEDRRDLGDREQGLYAASCLRALLDGAQTRWPQTCARHEGTDGNPAGCQPALEPRLRLGHADRRPPLPDPVRHRRLQPGMPGHPRRQLDLGRTCRPRTRQSPSIAATPA
jgi:putative transposase